jgi:hypothetical protein
MPRDVGEKLKIKWSDIKTRIWGNLTAVVGKGKQNVNMLTNVHHPPAEGNLRDEHGNSLK